VNYRDYITVLKVRYPPGAMMTKRLFRATNGAIGKHGYDNASRFDVQKIGIDDLADLAGVLIDLNNQPDKVVIRGLPTGGHYNVCRRLPPRQMAAFAADPVGHHWMFFDFDEVRLPLLIDPTDDPDIALGFLVRLLPPAFWDVSYYWQWSCGQGLDGGKTLRAHLFFWCRDKHTDRQFENWAKWVNGQAGEKILDYCVLRTVQPNYVAAPILGEGVTDPLAGRPRYGAHVDVQQEVAIDLPGMEWDAHVRQQEREEYQELTDYGLREPYSTDGYQPVGTERYLDYMARIGDDLDGFYDPMTKAIWHWAKAHPIDADAGFKQALRQVVREARCTKQRNLDEYLSDYRLDASLRGAREKTFEISKLEQARASFAWLAAKQKELYSR
jgi:hypothetical protein